MTPFNQKALELLKDTAILAQQQELDELINVSGVSRLYERNHHYYL